MTFDAGITSSINTSMDTVQRARTESQVNALNAVIADGKKITQDLGKDDFLKILITQLTHQDPTQPMEDREFIAQMAQFSTLEQMTNMSTGFDDLAGLLSSNQAVGLLGRTVDILDGEQLVTGTVTEVSGREHPQVLVNDTYYDYTSVERIR